MTDALPLVSPFSRTDPAATQAVATAGDETAFVAALPTEDALLVPELPDLAKAEPVSEQPAIALPLPADALSSWLEAAFGVSSAFSPTPQQMDLPALPALLEEGADMTPVTDEQRGEASPRLASTSRLEALLAATVPSRTVMAAPADDPSNLLPAVAQSPDQPPLQAEPGRKAALQPTDRSMATNAQQPVTAIFAPPQAQHPAMTPPAGRQPAAQAAPVETAQPVQLPKPAPAAVSVDLSIAVARPAAAELVTTSESAAADSLHLEALLAPRPLGHMSAADAPRPAPVTAAGPEARPVLQQITQALVSTNADRTEIALSPEELGRLRVIMSGADRAHVIILAERPETLDLVRRNADLLVQHLAEAGIGTGSMEFRQGERNDWSLQAGPGLEDGRDVDLAPVQLVHLASAQLSDRRIDIRL